MGTPDKSRDPTLDLGPSHPTAASIAAQEATITAAMHGARRRVTHATYTTIPHLYVMEAFSVSTMGPC
jgi:hypothetical protein